VSGPARPRNPAITSQLLTEEITHISFNVNKHVGILRQIWVSVVVLTKTVNQYQSLTVALREYAAAIQMRLQQTSAWQAFLVSLIPSFLVSVWAGLLFIRRVPEADMWMLFEFLDKRWLITLYFAWYLIFPVGVACVLGLRMKDDGLFQSRDVPVNVELTFDSERPQGFLHSSLLHRIDLGRITVFLVILASIWYLWGPPFGQGPTNSLVDYHEVVHWKGIQASLVGSTPYIGAGSNQYGPATQLIQVLLLKYVFEPSVETIRLSSYVIHFAALLFFVVVACLFMEKLSAVLAFVSAVIVYPSFSFFRYSADGIIGFWGWANIWRYSGLFLLGAGLPWLIQQHHRKTRRISAVLLGCVWAFTALMGQESLIGGAIVLALVSGVAYCTGFVSLKSWLPTVRHIIFGFLVCFTVYLTPYIISGEFSQFSKNYFLVARAVASGYSNTPWWEQSPWGIVYRVAPLISAVLLLLLAIVRPTHCWSDTPLSSSGPLWLSAFSLGVATSVAQAGSLTRSDSTHLYNTYILFPFFVAASVVHLSGYISHLMLRWTTRYGTVVLVALLFAMPGDYYWVKSYGINDRFTSPSKARLTSEIETTSSTRASITRSRMNGVVLEPENKLFNLSGITIAEVEELSAKLRTAVGDRSTYIDPALGPNIVVTNAWYFLADLRPHDVPYEEQSLMISELEQFANREALIAQPPDAYVTMNPNSSLSIDVWSRMRSVKMFEIPWSRNDRLYVYLSSLP